MMISDHLTGLFDLEFIFYVATFETFIILPRVLFFLLFIGLFNFKDN